ncbi:flagellar motor switch protein FliN/FliY [Desulfitispora alkaliphila]|uniref:flagellar motor switch phosphatase FliY n=1 Tax=Desulfitispora alkaliphila TaxID=622674 RepID=UPI003D261BDA
MDNNMLSQEEIDALLKGGDSGAPAETDVEEELTNVEKDAIGEIANISMGTAATTLSTLLGKKVDITTPQVSVVTKEELGGENPFPFVAIDVQYKEGISGNSVFIIQQPDAAMIVDLMMGGDGNAPPGELNDMHVSAIGEAMNQMMGSAATSLSTVLNAKIDISPPNIILINLGEENLDTKVTTSSDKLVKVSFRMVINSLLDTQFMQLIPMDVAKDMVENLMSEMQGNADPKEEPPKVAEPPKAAPQMQNGGDTSTNVNEPVKPEPDPVKVQPANFAPLTSQEREREARNIDLLLDIPLQISVELGKTKKTIKEILELTSGSVIELDKLAGEPVDLLVNGKLIAKGEVVVIDENFGIRVTDIVSPAERINNLKQREDY